MPWAATGAPWWKAETELGALRQMSEFISGDPSTHGVGVSPATNRY